MISFKTPEGFEADVYSAGDAFVQFVCDTLNVTHFGGKLPPISASAASRLNHPTANPVHAITFRTDEVPELKGLETPWLILIDHRFCDMPFLVQLLLHEMTHVLLPDENPYHSHAFWETLREKWLLDFNLVSGVGLNGDEGPVGLTKELLDKLSAYRLLGF
jgi:hypothetical protein